MMRKFAQIMLIAGATMLAPVSANAGAGAFLGGYLGASLGSSSGTSSHNLSPPDALYVMPNMSERVKEPLQTFSRAGTCYGNYGAGDVPAQIHHLSWQERFHTLLKYDKKNPTDYVLLRVRVLSYDGSVRPADCITLQFDFTTASNVRPEPTQ
jgi:hypothetical protein